MLFIGNGQAFWEKTVGLVGDFGMVTISVRLRSQYLFNKKPLVPGFGHVTNFDPKGGECTTFSRNMCLLKQLVLLLLLTMFNHFGS